MRKHKTTKIAKFHVKLTGALIAQENPKKSEPKFAGINSGLETVNIDPFFLDTFGSAPDQLHLADINNLCCIFTKDYSKGSGRVYSCQKLSFLDCAFRTLSRCSNQ